MFLIHTLHVQTVSCNGKMYTNYSQILLYTFIRLKNMLPATKKQLFF